MIIHLTLLLFIVFAFLSCASTNDDAIRQQEDFIKNHPTWKGHDFKYELSTKHDLQAVKDQKSFSIEETIKYYVEQYKA